VLEALKFVQRGVARRDIVPGLSHFRIKDKRVTGFNGSYSLSAPVDIGFNVAPNAGCFVNALNACEDVITLKMEGEHLLVRSGNFRTTIPCISLDQVPETVPEGQIVRPHGSLLGALKSLQPFVGVDASRPWACGVLFSKQSAYATNNIIVAEYWLGTPFPHFINVPSGIIDELCKVDEALTHLQIAEGSVTFHYEDGRWIKSQLLALDWPNIPEVLSAAWEDANLLPPPSGMEDAIEKLRRFETKEEHRVHLRGQDMSTHKQGLVPGGALIELSGLPPAGCYHMKYLHDVLKIADAIDFTKYPRPIPFRGGALRGALLGMTT
jgi:DNA polymerase III sliding clamp (beta) subunit (PCNA family)